jgi:hypothetical protein
MLWKTIVGKAAARGSESRNCETCRSVKFPASGNLTATFLRMLADSSVSAHDPQILFRARDLTGMRSKFDETGRFRVA